MSRPLWYLVLAAATTVLIALLGRFETPTPDPRPAPAWWRPLIAVGGVCAGLGTLAVVGLVSASGLNWPLLLCRSSACTWAGGPPARVAHHRPKIA